MSRIPTLPIRAGAAFGDDWWADRCIYCGQAKYEEVVSISQPIEGSLLGIGSIGAANKWRVKRCPECGHVLVFLVER